MSQIDDLDQEAVVAAVLEVIQAAGAVTPLLPETDIYAAGITSMMLLGILLDLEDRFQVTIPEQEFLVLRTARGLASMIVNLRETH